MNDASRQDVLEGEVVANTLQSLAAYLYAAPEWMVVVSVTIQEPGMPAVEVPLDDLEGFPLPSGPFRLSVRVEPPDHA